MRIVLTAVVAAALFFHSCNIINPAEKIPTYVRLDSFKITSNDLNRTGSTSSRITSAWVYVDNSFIGVYDVPSTIPILIDKKSVISFGPGVNFSGLKSAQALYPFYSFDTMTLNVAPGQTTAHTATATYTEATKFRWIEDFETGNTFLKLNDYKAEDTTLMRVSEAGKVFEGGGSGLMALSTQHPSSENINNKDIPISTGESYLEINYKCNTAFEIGLQTTKSGQVYYEYIGGVNANENWSKMYIGLQSFTGAYNATSCRVMIKASLPDGASSAYVLVDNIKVISY